MRLSLVKKFLSFIAILSFTACVASPPPHLDAKFGEAVETAKAQQTVNPDASLDTAALQGVDGQAGDAIFDNYRDSFINRPTTTKGPLNVGTTGSSASR